MYYQSQFVWLLFGEKMDLVHSSHSNGSSSDANHYSCTELALAVLCQASLHATIWALNGASCCKVLLSESAQCFASHLRMVSSSAGGGRTHWQR